MATHFKVTFIETYGTKEHVIECPHFYEKTNDNYLVEEVGLTENSVLKVIFEAPAGYRLYIDGLDQLDERFVFEDYRGVYIEPSQEPYELYNPIHNKNKPYPFIPGVYFLIVITPTQQVFEARAKIRTKRITEDQHTLMIQEIENAVQGLAIEKSSRRQVYSEVALAIFGPQKINEYALILSNKEKIISGLYMIEKNKRYSVVKNYPVIPKVKAKKLDGRSMKYLMMYPEQQNMIQAPVSQVTYQTDENSWMKSIALLLLKYVNEMKSCLRNPHSPQYNREQAQVLAGELTGLHRKLTFFLGERWMREVRENTSSKVPMAFFTVGTYSTFYKIYRELTQGPKQTILESKLQFHYKRSDLLYEIWGYLKIIHMFQAHHGYEVTRNCFQNTTISGQQDIDFIELTKGTRMLRVYYDEVIPNRREELSAYRPMFTMTNNKPDCRIDVWEAGHFKGSLIIDFKYRKKEYLWNDDDLSEGRPSKVMRQLEAYSSGMRSHTLNLNGIQSRLIDAQPVPEVWAVYPVKWGAATPDYEPNDYSIRLIDLSPGADNEHFSDMLESAVDGVVDR